MTDVNRILHYHKVLKNFLDTSSDALTPVTSSRVIKAREKLGKLTSSQFFDLSTDVYDELQRRTSAESLRPAFLPAQSNFHPKRNQARQKLASLPAGRFKDLVNDVLFEIERHQSQYIKEEDQITSRAVDDLPKDSREINDPFQTKAASEMPKSHNKKQDLVLNTVDLKTPINDRFQSSPDTPTQREIKSTKVVPQKSELSWSSDEDDIPEYKRSENRRSNGSSTEKSPAKSPAKSIPPPSPARSQQYTESFKSPEAVRSNASYAPSQRLSDGRDKDKDIKLLMEESSKMDNKISSLESELSELKKQKSELESEHSQLASSHEQLKNELKKYNRMSKDMRKLLEEKEQLNKTVKEKHMNMVALQEQLSGISDSKNRHLETENALKDLQAKHDTLLDEHGSVRQQLESVQQENQRMAFELQELQSLKQEKQTSDKLDRMVQQHKTVLNTTETSKLTNINNDLLKWQTRYEEARSEKMAKSLSKSVALSAEDLQPFIDPQGLVSMTQAVNFYSSVDSMLLYVTEDEISTDLLFERTAVLVSRANEIANAGKGGSEDLVDKSRLVQSAISNALTSARYYAMYRRFIPKLVINTAVNDVCFAVSDFLKVAKLKSSDTASQPVQEKYQKPVPERLALANDVELQTRTGSSLETPMSPARSVLSDDTESSVRPLRITQKLSQEAANGSEAPKKISKPPAFLNSSPVGTPIGQILVTPTKTAKDGFFDHSRKSSEEARDNSQRTFSPTNNSDKPDKETREASKRSQQKELPMLPKENPSPSNVQQEQKPAADSNRALSKNANGSVSSLASKFSTSQDPESPLKSHASKSSPKGNILARMKMLQENSDNDNSPTRSRSVSPARYVSDTASSAFDKFGARRRTSVDRSTSSANGTASNYTDKPQEAAMQPLNSLELPKPEKPVSAARGSVYDNPMAQEEPVSRDGASSGQTIPSAGSALQPLGGQHDTTAENFEVEKFNTLDPDNTLKELLLYLEHQTVEVIAAIQKLLESIKNPKATKLLLKNGAGQIIEVVKQMAQGTNTLMAQTRYAEQMGHAQYVVEVLEDCVRRMEALYSSGDERTDGEYADKAFKQRSAGIAFDVARSTKELVKTVEEASLRDEIAVIDSRLNGGA
ncbi:hypothetical protein KL937_000037 [Ogataea polymorpha]|nr:hypothetical protein KL937_000037 [Ogataea polymorpha]KAG7940649.1 hypothetical protein KL904_000512 [Ogataea polymorpha]